MRMAVANGKPVTSTTRRSRRARPSSLSLVEHLLMSAGPTFFGTHSQLLLCAPRSFRLAPHNHYPVVRSRPAYMPRSLTVLSPMCAITSSRPPRACTKCRRVESR